MIISGEHENKPNVSFINRLSIITKLALLVGFLNYLFMLWQPAIVAITPVDDNYFNSFGETIGADFTAFYTASVLIAKKDFKTLYSSDDYNDVRVELFEKEESLPMYFGYPPTALIMWMPLYSLDYSTALYVWILIGVIGVISVLYLMTRNPYIVILGATSPFMLWGTVTGQTGLICAAIIVSGFYAYKKNMRWTAGLIFGLLIIKPHVALALPFCLIASRNWKVILGGIGSGLTLIALSLLFFGVEAWTEFAVNIASNNTRQLESGSGLIDRMPTVYVTVNYILENKAIASIMHIITALFAIGASIYIWRASKDTIAQLTCLIVTPALIFVYYFDYDLSSLGILIAVMIKEVFDVEELNLHCFAPILLWGMGLAIYLTKFNGLLLGPVFLLTIMGYAIYRAKENPHDMY